jgi:hypothetical protein
MIVELTNCKVEIKDELTWGDNQRIQSAIMGGTKMSGKASTGEDMGFNFDATAMLEAKYIALECAIVEITTGDKKEKFTRDWMNNLSQSDGAKIEKAIDGLSKKG